MDWAYGAPEDATAKAGLPALGFYVGDRYRACNGALGTLKDITTRYVKILQKIIILGLLKFLIKKFKIKKIWYSTSVKVKLSS